MIRFFRTTSNGFPKHEHVFAFDDETGVVVFDGKAGHEHQVSLVQDPMSGETSLYIEASAEDAHLHEGYEELFAGLKKEKKGDELETVERVYSLFKAAYEIHEESIKAADESENFYIGEQWEERIRGERESRGDTCLTINVIEKDIDDLLGYFRKNRKEIRYFPVEGGDQKTADLANALSKVILEKSNFPMHQDMVFRDQVLAGLGNFNMRVETRNDVRGEIVVEAFPWRQVVYGPHVYPDASDCEYVVKYTMMSLDRVKKLYPEKAEDVEGGYKELAEYGRIAPELDSHVQYVVDQYGKGKGVITELVGDSLHTIDVATKSVMVMELQEKLLQVVPMAYFAETKEVVSCEGFKKKDLDKIKSMPGVTMLEPQTQRLRITRVCAGTLLVDENPADVPEPDFYIKPAYGKKVGMKFFGKIKNQLDPQREVNKRISQSIDIVDRCAIYGYYVDSTIFPTEDEEEYFRQNSSTPGFIAKVSQIERRPFKEEGIKFPTEVVNLIQLSEERIKRNLNVNPTLNAGANTSASAILQAEQAVLLNSENYFENHNRALKQVGKTLLSMIRRYYDPERIYRILSNQNRSNPIQIGGQAFEEFDQATIEQFVSNDNLEKLDVMVGEGNWTPTQRMATLMIMTDLMGKGAPIPYDLVIPFLDMPEDLKKQMQQGIQQQQQAQQMEVQRTGESEVQKALIGRGVFPPKVLQEQGIDPAQLSTMGIPVPQAMLPQGQPQENMPAGANAPI